MINTTLLDSILKHQNNNKYIVANTYLHILHKNPELLERYNLSSIEKLYQAVTFFLFTAYKLYQAFFYKEPNFNKDKGFKFDVLFVSHFTNIEQFNHDDPFFGDIPTQLSNEGLSSGICLINGIGAKYTQYPSPWKDKKVPRLILSSSLSFFSEIKLYFSQRKARKRLKHILNDLQVKKSDKKEILLNHHSPSTSTALRIAIQLADIVRKTNAKYIITTYEGHSWERLVYYYARKVNQDIKCFGYQHAAVFKYQYALKRPLEPLYNPDIILTSGSVSQKILSNCLSLRGSKVVCIGSPKYPKAHKFTNKINCCLVVPQGTIKECICLFKFSLTYAMQHKEQKFIWRLHPLMSFNKLKKYSSIFKNLPKNIYLSEGNFNEDINKCDCVLYRGTTAVINAINAGLRPIYYKKNIDELTIDPLYQMEVGKDIVLSQGELKISLNKHADMQTKRSLQDFAKNFYTPINYKLLKSFMQ